MSSYDDPQDCPTCGAIPTWQRKDLDLPTSPVPTITREQVEALAVREMSYGEALIRRSDVLALFAPSEPTAEQQQLEQFYLSRPPQPSAAREGETPSDAFLAGAEQAWEQIEALFGVKSQDELFALAESLRHPATGGDKA